MKNHIKIDGKLLQTNKKWSALKQSQRDWIYEQLRIEHDAYVESNKKLPMKKQKDIVSDAVYEKVEERGIWIPYGEYHSHVSVFIDRLNRKNPLIIRPEKKKDTPPKPIMPKKVLRGFHLKHRKLSKKKCQSALKVIFYKQNEYHTTKEGLAT